MHRAAGFSEIGTRRENEDSYAYWWAGDTLYAAVADGLGGMGGGGHASRFVVGYMGTHAVQAGVDAIGLAHLALGAHHGVRALQQQRLEDRHMASTLTVFGISGNEVVAAHCGDSRLYRVGASAVTQLSQDHSEAQRLFNEGRLTRRELASYPRRNILESAIGIPAEPVIQQIRCPVEAGDWLVLATDGAYARLTTADLADIGKRCRKPKPFAESCRDLIESRGPGDNYTMVVARVADRRARTALDRLLPRPKAGGNVPHLDRFGGCVKVADSD